jgi:hypothetical protein
MNPEERGSTDYKRNRIIDRQQNKDMLRIPFKDSNGLVIMECRRKPQTGV